MIRFLKFCWKKITRRRFKSYRTDEGHVVELAFVFDGIKYFHYPDATKQPAGRAMSAMTVYEEFNMRVTRDYLLKHCEAIDILFSNPEVLQLPAILQIHANLKERLQMALFPDHVYKLASVMFFDETESPYLYDPEYNVTKIERWKKAGGALDFFLKGPLQGMIPFSLSAGPFAETYFQTADQLDQYHQQSLQGVLSRKK